VTGWIWPTGFSPRKERERVGRKRKGEGEVREGTRPAGREQADCSGREKKEERKKERKEKKKKKRVFSQLDKLVENRINPRKIGRNFGNNLNHKQK
jgi:hypothetical protein